MNGMSQPLGTVDFSPINCNKKLTHIDQFDPNDNISSDCNIEICKINTTTLDDGIFLVPSVAQPPPMIVDLLPLPPPSPPRYPSHHRKSIQLSDFAYSIYSASFASLLTFIHILSKSFDYKKAIHDLHCTRQILDN